MTHKTRKGTTEGMVAHAQHGTPDLPAGVELNEKEMEVWIQMSRVRDDWRDFDLILLAKVVRLEVKIREWWETLDRVGPMIRNRRENLIENPILRAMNTLQNQQLSIITKMHIIQADMRAVNNAFDDSTVEKAIKDGKVTSLLAGPLRA